MSRLSKAKEVYRTVDSVAELLVLGTWLLIIAGVTSLVKRYRGVSSSR